VQLASSASPLAASWCAERSTSGNEEHLAISASAEPADNEFITVTLHVLQGRIAELELFDAIRGEGHIIDLDALRLSQPSFE